MWALYLEALTLPFQAVLILQIGANVKISEALGLLVIATWLGKACIRPIPSDSINRWASFPAAFFLVAVILSLGKTIIHYDVLGQSALISVTGVTGGRQSAEARSIITAAWAIYAVLNMFATASLIRDKAALRRVITTVLYSGAAAAIYAFYKLLFLNLPLPALWFPGDVTTEWARTWVIMRSDGTFFEPSTMANFYIAMMPLAFAAWLIERRTRWAIVLFLDALALMSSFSPGGWFAFAVTAIVFVPYAAKRLTGSVLPTIRATLLAVIVCVGALTAAVWSSGADPGLIWLNTLEKITGIEMNEDAHLTTANMSSRIARTELSGIALNMWLENPVLGVGIGNYPFLRPYYAERSGKAYWEDASNTTSVMYLLLLAETGLLGVSAFLFFGLRLVRGYWKAAGLTADRELKWMLTGAAGGLTGIAIGGWVLDNPFANYYWVIAGLGLAAMRLAHREARQKKVTIVASGLDAEGRPHHRLTFSRGGSVIAVQTNGV